jgi:outer membrane protein OmpU
MKKLLLTTAACGLVMAAAPAHAQIDLSLGGYFKGYGVYVDQDDTTNAVGANTNNTKAREFDFIRNTEIHFTGETTLDNGLTVGFHAEAAADGADGFAVDESYAYFSGGWGRLNFGDEDGAAYLLQVAAPSADDNIDGIRQFVNPVNYTALIADILPSNPTAAQTAANTVFTTMFNNGTGVNFGATMLDYDQDTSGKNTKLTYLTPVMNGFQLGVSYTADGDRAVENGVGFDNVENVFGEAYEGAARYEGQFNNVGVILGAGYTHVELERSRFTGRTGDLPAGRTLATLGDPSDDRQAWNVGADFDVGPFGLGVVYTEDDFGDRVNRVATAGERARAGDTQDTWVVGVDYTTGPFKFGASYMDQDNTFGIRDFDTKRYSGGVTYTYGPGMTFRGSIGHVDHDMPATLRDVDATYVTLGTQINF